MWQKHNRLQNNHNHVIAKKSRLRSDKNVKVSLLCILVNRPMRELNPQTPLAYALERFNKKLE